MIIGQKEYLKNCFEIKRETIPQSKLPRGSAGDQSSAFWCPGQGENRALHLVGSRFHELGRNCVTGIVQVRGWRHHIRDVNVLRLKSATVSVITLPDAGLQGVEVRVSFS